MSAQKTLDPGSKYDVREQVGKGAFGSAILVIHRDTRQQFIMKKVRLARQSSWQRQSTLQEMQMVSNLRHPYIVPHIESWIHHGHTVNIVYGYCEKGDLTTYLKKQDNKPLPEAQLRLWLAQMLLAMSYMHNNNILHRDIKGSNIFLTSDDDVQLGDFGLATYRGTDNEGNEDQNLVGTPHYMSPELLSQRGYSFASDVWSLGCVMYELTAGRPPFNAFNLQGLVGKIRKAVPPALPEMYSEQWNNIVKCMLVKDPFQRPTVQRILAQPLLQEALKEAYHRAAKIMPDVELPPLPEPTLVPLINSNFDQDMEDAMGLETTENNIVQRLENSMRSPGSSVRPSRINTANGHNSDDDVSPDPDPEQEQYSRGDDNKGSFSSTDSPTASGLGLRSNSVGTPSTSMTGVKTVAWGPTANGKDDPAGGSDDAAPSGRHERQASGDAASTSGAPRLARTMSGRQKQATQPAEPAARRTARRASSTNNVAKPKPVTEGVPMDNDDDSPLHRSLSLTSPDPQPIPSPREPSPRKARSTIAKTPPRRSMEAGPTTPMPRRAISTPRAMGRASGSGETTEEKTKTTSSTSTTATAEAAQKETTRAGATSTNRRTSDTGGVFDRLFKTPTYSRRAAAAVQLPEPQPRDRELGRRESKDRDYSQQKKDAAAAAVAAVAAVSRSSNTSTTPNHSSTTTAAANTTATASNAAGSSRAVSAGRTGRDRGRAQALISVLAAAPAPPSPVPEERSYHGSPMSEMGPGSTLRSHDTGMSDSMDASEGTGTPGEVSQTPPGSSSEPATPKSDLLRPMAHLHTPEHDRRYSSVSQDSFDSPIDPGSYPRIPAPLPTTYEQPADIQPLLRGLHSASPAEEQPSIDHVYVNVMYDQTTGGSPSPISPSPEVSRLPSRHPSPRVVEPPAADTSAAAVAAAAAAPPASQPPEAVHAEVSRTSSATAGDSVLSLASMAPPDEAGAKAAADAVPEPPPQRIQPNVSVSELANRIQPSAGSVSELAPQMPAADGRAQAPSPRSELVFNPQPLFRAGTSVLESPKTSEGAPPGNFVSPVSHWATQAKAEGSVAAAPEAAAPPTSQLTSSVLSAVAAASPAIAALPSRSGSGSSKASHDGAPAALPRQESVQHAAIKAAQAATANGGSPTGSLEQRVETLETVVRLCQGLLQMQRTHELSAVLASPALQQLGLPLPEPDPVLTACGASFKLGDVVLIGSKQPLRGTIRYCGPVPWDEGAWVGLELDRPVGKNDGTVAGVRYFTAAPNTGLFARATSLRPGAAALSPRQQSHAQQH